MSIRASLVRDITFLVLVLGLAIFVATFIGARRAVRSLSESLVNQTLLTVEAQLDLFFKEAEQQLSIARAQAEAGAFDLSPAEQSNMDDATRFRAERDQRNDLFHPIIEQSPQLSSLMLADMAGHEHMLLSTGNTWRNRITLDDRVARWLEWSDDSEPAESEGTAAYDPRSRPWFVGAIESDDGAVHWTEPYTFFTTKEPGITASTAFTDQHGMRRVLGFDVLLRDITEFSRHAGPGERGLVAVLSADRRLVGLPGLPQFDNPDKRAASYLMSAVNLESPLIKDAVAAYAQLDDPEDEVYRFRSGGEWWWACAEPYPLSGDQTLRVAILIPEAELIGSLQALRSIIILLVVLVLGFGIWRAYRVANRFVTPIEALVAQTERISAGDLNSADPIVSPVTEVQRLVRAQDQMKEGIRARNRLQKVERDLDLAREIQYGLLPQSAPVVAGFDIAGWNQPADETGGDFFDWIELPDGTIGFTLADVTGHGIGPALIVAVYRAYIRASTSFGSTNVADGLRFVNDLLYADIPDDRFITAVVGMLDPDAAVISMVSAGHGPLLYYEAATGAVRSWDADAVPLGIMAGIDIESPRQISCAAGDMLVLVTDGFFEWADAEGTMYGLRRLEQFLADHASLASSAFIEALYADVLRHVAGTVQSDDLTALVIKATPHDENA
ncbi:MAG: SpoIIE family protein phosphatase [Planctomycetota bacterium]